MSVRERIESASSRRGRCPTHLEGGAFSDGLVFGGGVPGKQQEGVCVGYWAQIVVDSGILKKGLVVNVRVRDVDEIRTFQPS